MRAGRRVWILCLSLVALLVLPQTCRAEELYFKQGCEYYKKGKFDLAAKCFAHVARKRPNYWPVHYQLGNTYMKLGSLEKARASYELCLDTLPDFQTAHHCQKAIKHINKKLAPRDKTKDRKRMQLEKNQLYHERRARYERDRQRKKIAELKKKKEAIMSSAYRQAARIREEARQRIRAIDRTTNQYVRNRRTGRIKTGITSDEARSIRADAELRARDVIRNAQVRARGIKIPESPEPEPEDALEGEEKGDAE